MNRAFKIWRAAVSKRCRFTGLVWTKGRFVRKKIFGLKNIRIHRLDVIILACVQTLPPPLRKNRLFLSGGGGGSVHRLDNLKASTRVSREAVSDLSSLNLVAWLQVLILSRDVQGSIAVHLCCLIRLFTTDCYTYGFAERTRKS